MLKKLGYYAFFALLIVIFGISGMSDVLSSKFVFILSGTVVALSLAVAIWLTITHKSLPIVDATVSDTRLLVLSKKSKHTGRTVTSKTVLKNSVTKKSSGKTRTQKTRKSK